MNGSAQQDGEVPNQKTCWALLERVAESSQLRRSTRLQNLLIYVGRRTLREGADQIHEQEIGVEVYGRKAGYDTNVDNIVRVNASELRKRLATYFETEGSHEPLIMDIPRGKYVPVFRYRATASSVPSQGAIPSPSGISDVAEAPSLDDSTRSFKHRSSTSTKGILAGLLIVLLGVVCVSLWMANRDLHRTLFPWRYNPLVAEIWSPFLDGSRDTDIVMEDSSFLLVENIDTKTYSFDEYLKRSYLDSRQTPQLSSQIRTIQEVIAGKTLARAAEVRLVQRILALNPGGRNVHIYNAREYTPALLRRDNVILLGNPTSNPWFDLYQDRLNFREESESQTESKITNNMPVSHEQATYVPTNDTAYGIVALMPKADHTGNILLIEGSSSEATEACGDFIVSKEQLPNLARIMNSSEPSFFEILLRVSHVTGTPITATIVAYRLHPEWH